MFGLLKPKRAVETPRTIASVPPGERVYAVGDIHGRSDLLETILHRIDDDSEARGPAETRLIFLGDLIDRGPDSAGVIDRLRTLQAASDQVRILAGNHEEVFRLALDGDVDAVRLFKRIGGGATLRSYGINPIQADIRSAEALVDLLHHHVPAEHVRFLDGLEDMVEIGDFLFVHAGIRPGVARELQRPADLRWIRNEFLDHTGNHGKIVVHGHTITDEPEVKSNRIGIDTGAFATGRLTALGLEGTDRWFISSASEDEARPDQPDCAPPTE